MFQGAEGKLLHSLAGERTHALRCLADQKLLNANIENCNLSQLNKFVTLLLDFKDCWLSDLGRVSSRQLKWTGFNTDSGGWETSSVLSCAGSTSCRSISIFSLHTCFAYSVYFQGGMMPEHCKSLWAIVTPLKKIISFIVHWSIKSI